MKTISKILRFKFRILGLALLASVFLLSGCNDDDEGEPVPLDVAFVALYNASPNAPDMNIIVDSRRINTFPFEYTDYTGYQRFYTGERTLQFGPYGADNVVVDTTVTFENNKAYSVFLVDEYADLDILVTEDNAETPEEGNAMVRFINLSPDAPELTLTDEGGSGVNFEGQPFMGVTDFMEVSAETHDFTVTGDGGDQIDLNVPDINLQSRWYYTIIVRGYANPPEGNNNVLSAQVLVN